MLPAGRGFLTWRRRFRGVAVVFAAVLAGGVLSPVLFGCVLEETPLWDAMASLRGNSYALTDEAEQQFGRFQTTFRAYAEDPENTRELKHFEDSFRRVRADYLRAVDDALLIDAALKGVEELEGEPGSIPAGEVVEAGLDAMVASLDPHSSYLNAEELKETFISTRGQFGGLGIEVTMEEGFVRVVSPIEGTPAYRAGMKPGDLITHLDGESIEDITIIEAVRKMRGNPGTDIRLTVRREGTDPFDVTITRAVITVKAVRWRSEGDIGYIRIASFTEQTEDGLEQAISELQEELGPRMRGIVLDLRNNPGGLLDQSLEVADAFLEGGRIVSVRGRDLDREQVFRAEPGDLARGLPVVVLINPGSASASEIVAGALQDGGRATVMGGRSFGKGSVQTITPLPIQGALKLTTALYLTPDGHVIQARGVVPDISIRPTEASERQREADLPGALAASEQLVEPRLGSVEESQCRAVGEKSDDRVLGCALAFIEAGSADRFLASVTRAPRM